MPRLRDLGVSPGRLPTGPLNAVTDVPGVQVGHVTLIAGEGPLRPGSGPVRTGVTAILPHGDNLFQDKVSAAVHTINGYGKACGFPQVQELGVLETPILLTNTLNVGLVADAVITAMLRQNPAIGITTSTVNPVVGETNDGYLNDIQGRHVHPAHVWDCLAQASGGPVREGCVGAGTGTICYGVKGGIGSASRRVPDGFTLGTLVQTNFGGAWDLMMLGVPVGQLLAQAEPPGGPGSVMVVLATDAPLSARQLGRVAHRAAFGLARTGSYGSHGSGDFVIAFSTTRRRSHTPAEAVETVQRIPDEHRALDHLFLATVEAVEEAVLNSLVAAETMTGRDGHTVPALPLDRVADLLKRLRLAGP